MYSGTPNSWTRLGGPFRSVVANDYFCFSISSDGQSVQLLQGGSSTWVTIGGPMASLLAAGNALYGTDTAGYVSRYSGVPMSWTAIGGPFKQIAIQGIHLI